MCEGAAVQWISRTQKYTSSETDYVAIAEGFKKAHFWRHVRRFLLHGFGELCICVFEHNKGAIHVYRITYTRAYTLYTRVYTLCVLPS